MKNTSWKDYFNFSKKERIAVFMLLLIILIAVLLPYLYPKKKAEPIIAKNWEEIIVDKHQNSTINDNQEFDAFNYSKPDNKTLKLFYFDPNTLDATGWKTIGLQDRVIKTIVNYRSKGGRFYKPEDIRKIYGMRQSDADQLVPYIQIQNNNHQTTNNFTKNQYETSKKSPASIININTATVEDFFSLPGVEKRLAYKMFNYREKLGGYSKVEDIKKTYGMTDSLFEKIRPYLTITPKFNKININTAGLKDMESHPSITKEVAQAILIYRNKYGKYQNIEEVKKIAFINEELFQKIAPFITVQ